MDLLFYFLVLGSSTYMIVLILSMRARKKSMRLRQYMNFKKIYEGLESKKLDQNLKAAGWTIKSNTWNLIRYVSVLVFLAQSYIAAILRGDEITVMPVLMGCLILLITSGNRLAPFGRILQRIHKQRKQKQDGEWISFLKLYEANRLRKDGYIEFSTFCAQVSIYFRLIQKDLLILSEKVINRGLTEALDWLVDQYPKDHPFMGYIRTIILSTDQVEQDAALTYLKNQNESIARLSNDYYSQKWSSITNVASVVNVLPIVFILASVIIIFVLRLWVTRPLIIY